MTLTLSARQCQSGCSLDFVRRDSLLLGSIIDYLRITAPCHIFLEDSSLLHCTPVFHCRAHTLTKHHGPFGGTGDRASILFIHPPHYISVVCQLHYWCSEGYCVSVIAHTRSMVCPLNYLTPELRLRNRKNMEDCRERTSGIRIHHAPGPTPSLGV